MRWPPATTSPRPWHAHHISERHSLFALIALGEGVVGTVAALSAAADRQGWTVDAVLVGIAGLVETVTLVAALYGVDVAKCLVILMLAPTVTVVGSEVLVAETPSTASARQSILGR
jgi:low temperature requirement A protein (LtrA)